MTAKFPRPESRRFGLLFEDREAKLKQWAKEDYQIMLEIAAENGISFDPNLMWFALALKLAKENPLYTEQKKRGRKTKWDDYCNGVLVVEIERIIYSSTRKETEESAAHILAEKEPWKSFIESKDDDYSYPNPGEVLRRKYTSFKNNKWADTCREAYKYNVETGQIDKWNAYVLEINSGVN